MDFKYTIAQKGIDGMHPSHRVYAAAKQHGLSMAEVAGLSRIELNDFIAFQKVEGMIPDFLPVIANTLGVTTGWLLFGDETGQTRHPPVPPFVRWDAVPEKCWLRMPGDGERAA